MAHSLRFQFRIGFTLFCLGFLILFCILGTWQIHRYHYKQHLLTTYKSRMTESPISFSQVNHSSDLEFQSVKVSGYYLNSLTLLVPNKFYQDKPGFEVYTPLKISNDKKVLLIDRGWIAKNSNGSIPNIKAITTNQSITGYIKLINEYQFILGDNILSQNVSSIIIQKIDLNEISQKTHLNYYPYVLRLNPKESNGFVRDWTITTMVPSRHMAYAFQWFGLAIVILIGYFAVARKK